MAKKVEAQLVAGIKAAMRYKWWCLWGLAWWWDSTAAFGRRGGETASTWTNNLGFLGLSIFLVLVLYSQVIYSGIITCVDTVADIVRKWWGKIQSSSQEQQRGLRATGIQPITAHNSWEVKLLPVQRKCLKVLSFFVLSFILFFHYLIGLGIV